VVCYECYGMLAILKEMYFIKYIAYESVFFLPFFFNGRILVVLKHIDRTPDCK